MINFNLGNMHPEEREVVRDLIKEGNQLSKGMRSMVLVGGIGMSITLGMMLGAAIVGFKTVSKKDAILYGHAEEVKGEFRWKNHPEHEPKKQ